MVKVIIGAPIYKRAWIIDHWLEYIEKQTFPLEDIGFIFELGEDDDETHDKLWLWHSKHPEVQLFDGVIRANIKHKKHPEGKREWGRGSFWRMVEMRNNLLDRVRAYEPERYYSLDSDILLEDPETISKLYETTKEYDAVGTLSYMTPTGTGFPSVMSWKAEAGQSAFRDLDNYDIGTTFQADIIMASKMMSPNAYKRSKYEWHRQGEDLGWSSVCARKKLSLACASNIFTAHIMHEYMLPEYLENGDARSTNKLG